MAVTGAIAGGGKRWDPEQSEAWQETGRQLERYYRRPMVGWDDSRSPLWNAPARGYGTTPSGERGSNLYGSCQADDDREDAAGPNASRFGVSLRKRRWGGF